MEGTKGCLDPCIGAGLRELVFGDLGFVYISNIASLTNLGI